MPTLARTEVVLFSYDAHNLVELPDDLAAALKDVAAAEHRSVQQTLVLAAQEYVERHKLRARVRESGRRIIEQDRELLDRLAQ